MDTYWHFADCSADGAPRLAYADGREIRVGETLTVDGEPVLCKRGLHASTRIIDALTYVHSDTVALSRVTLGGQILHDTEKSVATERTVDAMLTPEQTDKLLRQFARWCALSVAHLWEMPDIVRQYLETGNEEISAAASDAARDAASAAAWDAARDAASAAASDAAWDAASDAARAAASAAAWAAASAAAWAAAWDAASAAAWDAAWDAHETELLRLFGEYTAETQVAA